MGLLNWMTDKIIDKATDIAKDKIDDFVFEKTVEHIAKQHSVEKIVNNSVSPNYLFITKEKKSSYAVKDEAENIKYYIKTEGPKFGCSSARLYDCAENEIGKVILESKNFAESYGLYLNGGKLGVLIISSLFGMNYEIDFNDWKIDVVLTDFKTNIMDNAGNIIIKLNYSMTDNVSYILEYNEKENELIALLLLMAIYIIKSR